MVGPRMWTKREGWETLRFPMWVGDIDDAAEALFDNLGYARFPPDGSIVLVRCGSRQWRFIAERFWGAPSVRYLKER